MASPERPERDEKPGAARVLNPPYRERLFALIDGAPFMRHMGMRITDLAWGRATFEMTPAEFRLQPFGVVHGGNIATLIDSATFWACYLSMGVTTTASRPST
jgi:acyl-coenzyme A thioesterase PaaI-like protein